MKGKDTGVGRTQVQKSMQKPKEHPTSKYIKFHKLMAYSDFGMMSAISLQEQGPILYKIT